MVYCPAKYFRLYITSYACRNKTSYILLYTIQLYSEHSILYAMQLCSEDKTIPISPEVVAGPAG